MSERESQERKHVSYFVLFVFLYGWRGGGLGELYIFIYIHKGRGESLISQLFTLNEFFPF